MQVEPAFEAFGPGYAAGRPQVVWRRLVADLETPVSAYLKLSAGRTNTSLVRMELHAACGVERQTAAVRIAAS